MSPITKFEATGIFLSIAVMAIALVLLRFEAKDGSILATIDSESQGAVVVANEEVKVSDEELANALLGASTAGGELRDLVVDDVKIGTGNEVKDGDSVTVDYIGTTQEGVQFDSSYARGETFTFTVGEGKVIEGWEKGLLGMKVGGQRILVIPPHMAYGNRQVGPIPANSPLVFAIELHKVE